LGIFNTKGWEDRLEEVFATLTSNGAKAATLDKVHTQLDMLTPSEQELLSKSLHLNLPWNTANKAKRDILRAITFLEVLLFAVPPAIVSRYLPETDHMLKVRISTLLGSLEPVPQGKAMLGKYRPLLPGISISGGEHPGPGTIGCFVICNKTGHQMLLSNEHVLKAEFGSHNPGEKPIVRQPAKGNAGMAHDRVAEYARGFLDDRMDAAVAYLDPLVKGINRLPDGTLLKYEPGLHPRGVPVYKWGSASGKTMGWLGDAPVEANVPHGKFSEAPVHFRNQLQVSPSIDQATRKPRAFQIPGDSGSVLFDGKGRILGLLHGGGAGGLGAIAAPIDLVLQALDVRFDAAV
jgi:hypothetical protein